jgi:hypothetical protein
MTRANKDTARDIDFPLQHPRFIMLDASRDAEYFKRFIGSTKMYRVKIALIDMVGGKEGTVMRTLKGLFGKG